MDRKPTTQIAIEEEFYSEMKNYALIFKPSSTFFYIYSPRKCISSNDQNPKDKKTARSLVRKMKITGKYSKPTVHAAINLENGNQNIVTYATK